LTLFDLLVHRLVAVPYHSSHGKILQFLIDLVHVMIYVVH